MLSRTSDILQGLPGTNRGRKRPVPRFGSREDALAWKKKYRPDLIAAEKKPVTLTRKPILKGIPRLNVMTRQTLEDESEELPWKDRKTLGLKNPVALGVYGGGGLFLVGGIWWAIRKRKRKR